MRPFPNVDERLWQISTSGGTRPLWAPGGGELFYLTEQGLMSVSIPNDLAVPPGTPQLVFEGTYCGMGDTCVAGQGMGRRTYDVATDGQRFLMIKQTLETGDTAPRIILVQNWLEELKRLVPVN